MKNSRKIWLGLTTVLVTGVGLPQDASVTGSAPALAGPAAVQHGGEAGHKHGAPDMGKAGGEGGEAGAGGEQGAARLPRAVAFYREITMIRGHLRVADELVQAGKWDEALLHVQHPVEQNYDAMRSSFRKYKTPPFDGALKALIQSVKARKPEAYAAAAKTVAESLAKAEAGVRASQTDQLEFGLDTMLATLQQAGRDYGEAIQGDRIVKPMDYQDARGFVFESERLLDSVAPIFAAADPKGLRATRDDFAELKKAWPTVTPPAAPTLDKGQVLSLISRIELHSGSLK